MLPFPFQLFLLRHRQTLIRFSGVMFLLALVQFSMACTTDWVTQASNIITLLVPAIEAALGILAAFGAGISPDVLSTVEKWASEAVNDLNTVVAPLIDQYNAAEASAQPGILNQIEAALQTTISNLATILTAIHITDQTTQAKILAVFDAVLGEMEALLKLVPAFKALEGHVGIGHDQLRTMIKDSKIKSAGDFKKYFNGLVAELGPEAKKFEL